MRILIESKYKNGSPEGCWPDAAQLEAEHFKHACQTGRRFYLYFRTMQFCLATDEENMEGWEIGEQQAIPQHIARDAMKGWFNDRIRRLPYLKPARACDNMGCRHPVVEDDEVLCYTCKKKLKAT